MSYAIATNELSLADRKAYIAGAVEAGIARAQEKLGLRREELVTREAHPLIDFVGGYTNDYYLTTAPGAAGWLAVGDVGAAVYGVLPIGRVAVFYKVGTNGSAAAAPLVTAVRFLVGATGASTLATFFIQEIVDNKLEPEAYFSEPIVYDPQDTLFMQWYARAGGAAEELSFGCFIVEKLGAVVS